MLLQSVAERIIYIVLLLYDTFGANLLYLILGYCILHLQYL